MKRKLMLLIFPLLLVSCNGEVISTEEVEDVVIRYLTNTPKEQISLESEREAIGENTLYYSTTIKKGEKVASPVTNPIRQDYIFDGWYMDLDATIEYDFDKTVESNLNLYAGWKRDINSQDSTYQEPNFEFTEKVDDSVTGLNLTGVLNFEIDDNNNVFLPTLALAKLEENKENVKECLNYSINSNSSITSATYQDDKITISYKENQTDKELVVEINDASNRYVVNNSGYENKAKKYETVVDFKDYSIVLAGSSSIENWKDSKTDMDPLTTINVGIGGTTAEQWTTCLAPRLIYPYNPREVVLYVGINNVINAGNTGDETGEYLVALFDDIHQHLPNTHIYYIYMNLVPGFMTYKLAIERGNEIVTNYGKDKDYISFIDAGKELLKEDGKPNSCYFLTDGLHMSLYGYTVWGQFVKNFVIEKEKELYK